MPSNILLNCVCVLAWIASLPTDAREIRTLHARQGYLPILATPTSPLVETVTTVVCLTSHPKVQIQSFLDNCNDAITAKATDFQSLCNTTNDSNAPAVAAQVASDLQEVLNFVNLGVAQIQKCGIVPSPLQTDMGVSTSDISHSAFEVVLTLKPIFDTVTDLMSQFPVVNDSCDSILNQISTALSNLVGACSEQVNLFDVGFFKLATPQMKDFNEIGGNFAAFYGSFI